MKRLVPAAILVLSSLIPAAPVLAELGCSITALEPTGPYVRDVAVLVCLYGG